MKIAIVEDDVYAAKSLAEYIKRYGKENDLTFAVLHFTTAEKFLEKFRIGEYSMIFLDIDLPGISGMDVAESLREIDKQVPLIFVTKMAQYAQRGYSVSALDFILKPIGYPEFSIKMQKAIKVARSLERRDLLIPLSNGFCRISTDKLLYVEVEGHRLRYVLTDDVKETRGSLTEVEKRLKDNGFLRCNSCYLVNARFIDSVRGNDLTIAGYTLTISKPKRKAFMDGLAKIFGGNGD